MKRVRRAIGIGARAFSLAVVGCGGSPKKPAQAARAKNILQTTTVASRTAPAATMTKQQAGQAYLAAVAPANAVGAALAGKMRVYADSTSGSQISAEARPLERRLTELNGKLLGIATAYPPAAADLKALSPPVTRSSAISGAPLGKIRSAHRPGCGGWQATWPRRRRRWR